MANRFPLIFNSGAGQIQELAVSDNLDLTSSNLVNAGILFTSSGSVTAPSLQIGSGTTYNPGLYSPGADQLAISTSGTGRVFVDGSGRVGVGGASAGPLFLVNGTPGTSTTANLLSVRNGSAANANNIAQVDFWCANSFGGNEAVAAIRALNPNASGNNGGALVFATSLYGTATTPSERIRITNDGLVGIGTSSPAGAIQVSNAGYAIFNNSANAQTPVSAGLSIGYNRSGANGEVSLIYGSPAAGYNFEICSFASSTITPRLTIDSSGRLLVGTTANANGGILQLSSGITFPATAVAANDANTLDDYEEGSWTPVYTASTTNPTMVYNAAEGRYTKVGRLVTCYFHMRTNTSSTGGGVGDLLVSGLPFTSANIEVNAGRQSGAIGGCTSFGALNYPNGIIVNNNSTTAALQIIYTTANTIPVDASTLSLASQGNSLFGCFSYITG